MIYQAKLEDFKRLISKIEMLDNTRNSLIYWDKITNMPADGIEYRSQVMAYLADEQYKLMSGREFNSYISYFKNNKRNDKMTDAMVRRICSNSGYVQKIPEAEYKDYVSLYTKAEKVWEKAKQEKKVEIMLPYWAQIFNHFRNFAVYWGYEEKPYDALMGYYNQDLTVAKMDEMVGELKRVLIDYREQIHSVAETEVVELTDLPKVEAQKQKQLWEMMLTELGFSFEAGRVDVGSHPTMLSNSPYDVRIVNTYSETDFRNGIFNVLHSGGKAIYQQSISKELMGTLLAEAPSWILEEAIGRFYENILGRSKGFWQYFHGKMTEIVPEIDRYTPCQLFKSANCAEANAVRLEADELTYLLHIIVRYEIEREIFDGTLDVEEIPATWNRKYQDYLGICPEDDEDGVLQDIHWSAGYVGYFPTYIVANLAAAQIADAIERDCGNLDDLVANGRFDVINDWLKEHIFRHGAIYTTTELIERATGKPLEATHYLDYLRNKFSEVYKINL